MFWFFLYVTIGLELLFCLFENTLFPLLSACLVKSDSQVNEKVEVTLCVAFIEMGMHLIDCNSGHISHFYDCHRMRQQRCCFNPLPLFFVVHMLLLLLLILLRFCKTTYQYKPIWVLTGSFQVEMMYSINEFLLDFHHNDLSKSGLHIK